MSTKVVLVTRVPKPRKNRKKTQGGNRGSTRAMIPHPPMITSYSFKITQRLRFTASNTLVGQVITYQNLLDTLVFATSATTVYDYFNVVKVLSVEMWSQATNPQVSSVSLLFNESDAVQSGDRQLHTDTSMGVQPAHLIARPKKDTISSKWHVNDADTAFTLWIPANAVIDVTLCLMMSMNGGFNAAQNASVGATAGKIYSRGLDGAAFAATQFVTIPGAVQI